MNRLILFFVSIMVSLPSLLNSQTTQMAHWYIGGFDFNFNSPNGAYYNYSTAIPNVIDYEGATNGYYDENGNTLFYIYHLNVYNSNGTIIGNFGNFHFTNHLSTECTIIPVPGQCNYFYIITNIISNLTPNNSGVEYMVVKHENGIGSFVNQGIVRRCGSIDATYKANGFAISNTINAFGDRYLYMVYGNTNNIDAQRKGSVVRFTISSSGISSPTTIMNHSTNNIYYSPLEVDLSPDGQCLAWGSVGALQNKVYNAKLVNGHFDSYNEYNTSGYSAGVEFSHDSQMLFYTDAYSSYKIKYVYPNTSPTVVNNLIGSNNSSLNGNGQLELANDGLIYFASSSSGSAISINPSTFAIGEKNINICNTVNFSHYFGLLPDQIDGFDYNYAKELAKCCYQGQTYDDPTYMIGPHTSATWNPAANPFANGSSIIKLFNDIIIDPGVEIIIQDLTIEFGPDAKVIVQPGGKLILNNSILTGLSDCNTMWKGVEVHGTYNQSQDVWLTNGMNQYQGQIIVKGQSEINNAYTAIQAIGGDLDGILDWTKTGGIIQVSENSLFLNNRASIWIGGYKNYLPNYVGVKSKMTSNRSFIVNSSFSTDNDFYGDLNFHWFIGLVDGSGINIQGNNFINSTSYNSSGRNGIGIVSIEFPMNVNSYCDPLNAPCTSPTQNSFSNLIYGIKAESITSRNQIIIDGCNFNFCYYGVYLNNTTSAKVTNNYFTIPWENLSAFNTSSYGLYLDGDKYYKVENNYFQSDDFPGTHGLIVNNSGGVDNEIYRNHFNRLKVGIKPQLQNKGKIIGSNVGLKLLCNDFAFTAQDIIVLGSDYDPWNYQHIGIAQAQKISSGIFQPKYYPAGNIFSSSHFAGIADFDNTDAEYLVYSHETNTSTSRFKPEFSYNIGYENLEWIDNRCPSKLVSSSDINLLYSQLNQATVVYNSSRIIRDIWKDGGDLDLSEEVQTTATWEAYQQFNQLISESPYLSEGVLIEMINNDAFTDLMVKLVMIANPQGARSTEVMQAIYDRIPSLPQNYIDDILNVRDNYSPLSQLEADVLADYSVVRQISNEIITLYRNDNTNLLAYDSLIAFCTRLPGLEDKYSLASIYLEYGDYINAMNVLNSIPNNFELDEKELLDYSNNLITFDITMDIISNDLHSGQLTSSQVDQLLTIVEQNNILNKSKALALLRWNDLNYTFTELVLEAVNNDERKAKPKDEVISLTNRFEVFPNPATDYITVKLLNLLQDDVSMILEIKDATGKTIKSYPLDITIFESMINIEAINSGVYQIVLRNNLQIIESQKLIIVK
jgi:hypothetical protein